MSVETARTGLRGALLALLLLSPLPFGSVEPWAVLALELSAAALGAVALCLVALDPAVLESRARMALALGGTVVLIGVVQLVPLPGGWSRLVASPTQALREQLARFLPEVSATVTPQSLEPPATSDAVLRFAAYVLIGLAAVVAVRTPAHLRQVAVVIAASGAFQAIYGSAEYLTGHQHIFGYAKKFYADEASGTFINRNHFAGYLAMTLPFALGLMLDSARSLPDARSFRERILQLGETGGLRLALGAAAAAAIWIGVILSYSRGGLAVALAGTAFLAWRLSLRRRRAWLLVAALLIPTALLLWSQVRAPGERFVSESSNVTTLERPPARVARVAGHDPRLLGSRHRHRDVRERLRAGPASRPRRRLGPRAQRLARGADRRRPPRTRGRCAPRGRGPGTALARAEVRAWPGPDSHGRLRRGRRDRALQPGGLLASHPGDRASVGGRRTAGREPPPGRALRAVARRCFPTGASSSRGNRGLSAQSAAGAKVTSSSQASIVPGNATRNSIRTTVAPGGDVNCLRRPGLRMYPPLRG